MSRSPVFVCFDLGEVLVRIRHFWMECARAANAVPSRPCPEETRLTDFPPFLAFQDGTVTLSTYIGDLAAFLGITGSEAALVHNSILKDMMPGTLNLVQELQTAGVDTGCLSNTNAPHWDRMLAGDFPNVDRLRVKMASHEVRLSKPDPAIFHAFEQSCGHPSHEILFFDDTQVNVAAAEALGWRARRIVVGAPVLEQITCALSNWGIRDLVVDRGSSRSR